MFNTVVVAVDGSPSSERALEYGVQIARENSSHLVLAHVTELVAGRSASPVRIGEQQLVEQLSARAAALSKDGTPGAEFKSTTAALGGPAHAIAEIAEEAGADLLITGTRGHTGLTGLVVGGVAQRILHLAPCPVLIVPEPHEN